MKTESAIDRLVRLWDLLEEADSRIEGLKETARFLKPIDEITGSDSSALFKRRTQITQAAKRRILEAIYAKLRALKTVIKLEIENEKSN